MRFLNYFKNTSIILGVFALGISPAFAQKQPTNIALGKTVTFSDKPNYKYSADPEDHLQLTDGKYVADGERQRVEGTTAMWVQKSAVGWQNKNPVVITVDLGKVQSISGASFSTAANRGNIHWPTAIYVATSNDRKNWYPAGELIAHSGNVDALFKKGYSEFRFTSRELQTYGRYVAFTVFGVPSVIITDEIEVYAGDPQWLERERGSEAVSDLKEYAIRNSTLPGIKRRLRDDLFSIRSLVSESDISAHQKNTLMERLEVLGMAINRINVVPPNFKAVVPLNEVHRDILAVHGELLAAQKINPITVWKQHRYAWLPLLHKPRKVDELRLNFSMLQNQYRSDTLLITNASSTPQEVDVELSNPPKGALPGWIKMESVEWTDTQTATVVADALIPLDEEKGVYSVTIPAGLTRKLWITVDSSRIQQGTTESTLIVKSDKSTTKVPVTFRFSPIKMNEPRLSVTMWDYSNSSGYGINPENREASIELMRSHFVDSPWAGHRELPFPQESDFNEQNELIKAIDFTNLDNWIAQWPGAKRYFIYRNLWGAKSFAGAHIDSPNFAPRVGSWIQSVVNHIKQSGLDPKKFYIQFVDEPHTDDQDAVAVAWAKAVRAAAPELKQFSNPMWARPDQTEKQDAITMMDALSPLLHKYRQGGKPVQQYYAGLQAQGKELWFYATRGPIRELDPQMYYRYQAWHTFAENGQGHGFWSFSSFGKASSSWNEYTATGINYAPVFFDDKTVHNSVHWEAMRESVEDHEELAMLQDAIANTEMGSLRIQAQKVLDEAVQAVTATWENSSGIYSWDSDQYDPHLADDQLKNVRAMLEKLRP